MSENGSNSARKSLKTLQRAASDQENLVGRPSKSLKHHLSQDSPASSPTSLTNYPCRDAEVKRKNLSDKETQANLDSEISVNDLTKPEPSKTYWKRLAEKRQISLQESLDENERLRKVIEDLKEENTQIKQMLEEANSFIEIVKEELNSNDDTGIDVNDVSTADETTENGEDIPTPGSDKK